MDLDETIVSKPSTEQKDNFCIRRVNFARKQKGPIILLKDDEVVLGRHPHAQVLIRSDTVSRKHAVLKRSQDGWNITDTLSTNGVWVNKGQLSPLEPHQLKSGDIFSLGEPGESDYVYKFTTQAEASSGSPAKKVARNDPEQERLDKQVEFLQRQLELKEAAEKLLQDKILAQQKEYQERLEAEQSKKRELQQRLETEEQALRVAIEAQRAALLAEKEKVEEELRQKLTKEMEESLRKEQQRLNQHLEQSSLKAQLLEQQLLQSKNQHDQSKSEMIHQFGNLLETELNCSICSELFVEAYTLGCSHTFCKHCITQWKKKKNDCPICRNKIKSMAHALVVDNFIEQMVNNLSPTMKDHRYKVFKERGLPCSKLASKVPDQGQPSGSSSSAPLHISLLSTVPTSSALVQQSGILLRPVSHSNLSPQVQAFLGPVSGPANTFRLVTVNGQQTLQLVTNSIAGNGAPVASQAQNVRFVGNAVVPNAVTTASQPRRASGQTVVSQATIAGGSRTRAGVQTRGGRQTTLTSAVRPVAHPLPQNVPVRGQVVVRGGGVRTRGGVQTRGGPQAAPSASVLRINIPR